jgi:hypothetical protein
MIKLNLTLVLVEVVFVVPQLRELVELVLRHRRHFRLLLGLLSLSKGFFLHTLSLQGLELRQLFWHFY